MEVGNICSVSVFFVRVGSQIRKIQTSPPLGEQDQSNALPQGQQRQSNPHPHALPPFPHQLYIDRCITRVDSSSIAARRITDGRNVYRDSSQFKLANALMGDDSDQEIRGQGTELNHVDWRQGILMNAGDHAEAEEATLRPEPTAESNPKK